MATEIVIQETVFNIDTGAETSTVEITLSNDQGPQGSSGIIAVTSPITNSGTSTSAQIGINQAALAIGPSQVTGTAVVKTPTATQTITNSTNGIVPLAINQTATNHALTSTLGASSGADTVALNVVSSNELSSAMWLSGKERAHGTLKIAHVQPDTASDANAGAISINLHPSFDYQSVIGTASFSSGATSATFTASSGTPTVGQQFKGTGVDSRTLITAVTGASSPFTLTIDIATTSASDAGEYRTFTPTAAQGIFIDTYETPGGAGYTSSGTTGSLLNLRNGGNSKLVLNANGQLQLPTVSATGGITIGGDTELFRAASKVLRSNSALYLNNTTSDSVTLYTSVTSGVGGSVAPFALKNTGKLEWGASGSARDTFLYRTGVNALTTDGSLTATSFVGSGTSLTGVAKLASANAFTVGGHTITNASDVTGLLITANASQTVPNFQINTSTGARIFEVGNSGFIVTSSGMRASGGYISGNTVGISGATSAFWATSATNIPIAVRGAASQTADLQQWQNSAGSNISGIASNGANYTGTFGGTFGGGISLSVGMVSGSAGIGQVIRGSAAQTGALVQHRALDNTILGGVNALAQIHTGSTAPITSNVGGATTAASGNGTTATITTTTATNLAVGDIVVVSTIEPAGYRTTGAVVTAVSNSGTFTVSYANTTTGSQTVAGTVATSAQASITARSAGTKGLVIKSAASQVENIQEWQSSAGTVLAYVTSAGVSRFEVVQGGPGAETDIRRISGGGALTMRKTTSAVANPGTDSARIYLVTGTTAGTLKLVVRAGTAGAETTILDNIPQT